MGVTRTKAVPAGAVCRCGEPRGLHWKGHCWRGREHTLEDVREARVDITPDIWAWACDCTRYRPAKPPLRGSRRSIRSAGISAQGAFNKAAGFTRREGHGADGVYEKADGTPVLVQEHKHYGRFSWADVRKAIQQAETYCNTMQGRPVPCAGYTSKPGQGRAAYRYLIIRAEDFPEVARRLSE